MEVFLRKSVAKIGLAGEIIKVGDGFARNFLIPQGLAVEITANNKAQFEAKIRKVENRKEIIASEMSLFADRIEGTSVTLKRKMHDNGSLYGAISASDIVEALSKEGINVTKSQVDIEKPIKAKGSFKVTIKLSSHLKPSITAIIEAE